MNTSLVNGPKCAIVVGSGSIGEKHLLNIKATYPDCTLISIPSRSRAMYSNAIADVCFSSIEESLEVVPDFAIIASPASMHLEHSRTFAKNKTPILVEKPLTNSFKSSNELLELVESTQLKAKVGYCLRQLPAVQFVKKHLLKGSIGKIVSVTAKVAQYLPLWRPGVDYKATVSAQKSLGGGALLELSHELDLISYFFGETSVTNATLIESGSLGLEVEEIAHITLSTFHKAVVSVELNFLQQHTERYMVVTGEQGTMQCDWLTNQVKLVSARGNELFNPPDEWANNNVYQQQLMQFVQYMENETSNLPSIYEGVLVNKLIDEIRTIANVVKGN